MKKRALKPKSRIRRSAPDMRAQALAAARRIIVDDPDETLTMRAVAEATGVTHPNLIHHFGSLAGLHAALAEEMVRELLTDLRALHLQVNTNDNHEELVDQVFQLFSRKGLGPVLTWLVRFRETARLKPVNALLARFIQELAQGHTREEAESIARDALILTFAAYSESMVGDTLGEIFSVPAAQRRRYFVQVLSSLSKAS